MKKIFLIAILCLCTLCFSPPLCAQLEYQEEEVIPTFVPKEQLATLCGQPGTPIRVAGFATNPPLGWTDTNFAGFSLNKGYALDLFEQMAKELGLLVQNRGFTSYYKAIAAVKSGDADVLLGVYYDPKNLEGIELIYPSYLSNPFIIAFKKGRERAVTKWADLANLKGVVRIEEMIYPLIHNSLPLNINLTQVSGARNAFTGLMDDTYDYLLTGLYAGEAEIRRFKLIDNVVMTEVPLTQPELFFGIGKNSECLPLKETFAQKITALKENQSQSQRMIIKKIDEWGLRFANNPGLIREMNGEAATAPDPTDETLPRP